MITLTSYEAGEVIVQENDFGETAYVIEQGQVEVSKALEGPKCPLGLPWGQRNLWRNEHD